GSWWRHPRGLRPSLLDSRRTGTWSQSPTDLGAFGSAPWVSPKVGGVSATSSRPFWDARATTSAEIRIAKVGPRVRRVLASARGSGQRGMAADEGGGGGERGLRKDDGGGDARAPHGAPWAPGARHRRGHES